MRSHCTLCRNLYKNKAGAPNPRVVIITFIWRQICTLHYGPNHATALELSRTSLKHIDNSRGLSNSSPPHGAFGVLVPPNKDPSTPNLNYEALQIGGVFIKFQNVKPFYWKLCGDGSESTAVLNLCRSTASCDLCFSVKMLAVSITVKQTWSAALNALCKKRNSVKKTGRWSFDARISKKQQNISCVLLQCLLNNRSSNRRTAWKLDRLKSTISTPTGSGGSCGNPIWPHSVVFST